MAEEMGAQRLQLQRSFQTRRTIASPATISRSLRIRLCYASGHQGDRHGRRAPPSPRLQLPHL